MSSIVLTLFTLLSVYSSLTARTIPYKAVVHIPVADLLGQSILDFKLAYSVLESYAKLPLAAVGKKSVCPRIHQALFNEVVTVIEEHGDELRITLPHVFYSSRGDATPHNIFWILKKHVTPLDVIESNKLSACIPQPIDVTKKNIITVNADVVTLWLPFMSPATNKIYSAGTRFVQAAYKRGRDLVFKVYEYDPVQQQMHTIKIPKKYCFQTGNAHTPDERIAGFVGLLTSWVQLNTVVPSVQGGCSFATECESDTYRVIHTRSTDGAVTSYWERPEMRGIVQSGFDISGMVLRAAQICGIPYYFKSSVTAEQSLAQKNRLNTIVEGDMVWVDGGLFVISNLKDNMVIACCGYDPGYGRVIELPLNKVFNNITTFSELIHAINNGGSFERMGADGNVLSTTEACKILSMKSAWDF